MPKKHGPQKRVRESRVSRARLEVRSTKQGRSLTGYFAVYNSQSENLGGFVEIIAPGAFNKSLRTQQVAALIDHDAGRLIGKSGNNLTLSTDSTGLRFTIQPLPNTTQVNDLLSLADQGLITSCSFGMYVISDDWSTLADGTPLRTVTEAIIFEGSILTGNEPAYTATSVSARALARAKRRDDLDDDYDDPACDPDSQDYDEDECEDDRDLQACSCTCQQCVAQRCDRCLMDSCTLRACGLNGCPAASETARLRRLLKAMQQGQKRGYDTMTTDEMLAHVRTKLNR